jgi:hypothetical protein
MMQAATYAQRSGREPDTLFQRLSKHAGGDERLKKTLRFCYRVSYEEQVNGEFHAGSERIRSALLSRP